MKKRIITLVLAITMVLQTMVPVTSFAEEITPEQNNLVKVGSIDIKTYPQLDAKTVQEANRRKKQELQGRKMERGAQLFSAPYFPNPGPDDKQKPLIFANVNAIFTTKGLDGGNFDWEGVFGKDSDGKLNKAQIVFEQMDDKTSTRTGVKFFLKVDKAGTYTWSDSEGKPTKLPLYSTDLKPYRYEVLLDEDVTEHVKLLTARFFGTEGGYSFGKPDPVTGEIVGNINLDLSLQQIASTKFTSKWNTGVAEAERPTVEGSYLTGYEADLEDYGIFKFPSNDTDKTIIRNDQLDPQNPGDYSEYLATALDKTPTVGVADPDPDATDTYTIDRDNSRISYKGKTYKYDLKYDVINGGKLTMTEMIPVTFDANGGKFANFTAPDTETNIVKEVEYDGTTDKAEDPKKEGMDFAGWSLTKDGPVAADEDFTNIKAKKTFYAIWSKEDIQAEELVVAESLRIDKKKQWYKNDFVPSFEVLKAQVKVKDNSGNLIPLPNGAEFSIINDKTGFVYTTESVDLKNFLYDKVKENNVDEVSRTETVKAKVTYSDGTTRDVDIPIKVFKNIYRGSDKGGRLPHIPANYVKVTLDPTDKAKNPEKIYYYVNPKAQVEIKEPNVIGKDSEKPYRWTMPGTSGIIAYNFEDRNQFTTETTITAEYSADVVPQTGTEKPEGVPNNFVQVTFVPTDKATDATKTNQIFWVNPEKEVTIPVKDPVGKQYFTFIGWKIGEDKYNPNSPKQFTDTNGTIITATYEEAANIIPFDPTDYDDSSIVRPDGYAKITFKADTGLKLKEDKAYYVKKNAKVKLSDIKSDTTNYGYPAYEEQTGYKFDKWDKEDSLVIEATDIEVTAKATPLADVVPKDKPQGGVNDKPAGYITVTFSTEANGNIKDSTKTTKVVYVNPNKAVVLTPYAPEVTPKTGFEFADWDTQITKKVQYSDGETIKALYNELGDVIPQEKTDGSDKPTGYLTVTFDRGEHGELSGKTVYYVKPNKEVTVPAPTVTPKTGWKQKVGDDAWDKALTQTFTGDTKITAQYDSFDDIIPGIKDDGTPNDKPEGYVTVTFDKGEHGNIESGQTVYYVNPDAGKTIGDLTKPNVKPETGWKQKSGSDAWNFADTKSILSDITVIAQYDPIADVVPGDQAKPNGYYTVTFVKGDHGKSLTGQTVYYVNPNKAVVLKDKAPTAVPNAGYQFARWDISIDQAIQYKDGAIITALYNDPGNISTTEVEGYATVEFKTDDQGTLTGTTKYWVKPNVSVNVPAPTVNPNDGYKFKEWDKSLTVNLQAGAIHEITAKYEYLGDIIPQQKTDGTDKPNGYVTVKFEAVNGTLSGTTVYYVNPNNKVDLTNTAAALTKNPYIGYTTAGGKWDKDLKAKFKEGDVLTFTFESVPDVIEAKPGVNKPNGYVTVAIVPTEVAKDPTVKYFFVNPNKEVTISVPDPTPKAKYYTFINWDQPLKQRFDKFTVIYAQFKFDAKSVPGSSGGYGPGGYYPGGSGFIVGRTTEKIVKVPDNSYFKEVWYMQGFKGNFRPKDGLTRAEAAQILANALVEDGYRYNPNFKLPYRDIGEEWYTKAIRIVTEARVFEGYDDGNFKPQSKITRNEWIATLKRFQVLGDVQGNHMNLNNGHWATAEIEAAYNAGWLKIYTDGVATYEGDKFIPRQEVAAVSNKAFNRVLDKTYIRKNDRNLVTYRDVNKDMWAYDDILCASNTFLAKRDMYFAQWVDRDNNIFNIYTKGFDIVQAKFQRISR